MLKNVLFFIGRKNKKPKKLEIKHEGKALYTICIF